MQIPRDPAQGSAHRRIIIDTVNERVFKSCHSAGGFAAAAAALKYILYRITANDIYIKTFKQQIYNIIPQLVGSGPFMTGWGMQLLNYLSDHLPITTEEQ